MVRPWPDSADVATIVLLDQAMVPTSGQLARWIAEIERTDEGHGGIRSVRAIRTSALFPRAAGMFERHGFTVIDRLALLERSLDRRLQRPQVEPVLAMRRLRRRDLSVAAGIDRRAFPVGWANDEQSLDEICRATPVHRRRVVRQEQTPVGFAITGRANTTGYVQRLAVDPDHRRGGIGRMLVDDALWWLGRRGATTVLVNTGVDNEPALRLYREAGFWTRPEELVVMEREIERAPDSEQTVDR